MRQVVLTHLPGLNYFIGTFDIGDYKIWWKSQPLPGDVADIEHALWVGGPYHLALARMTDGTWSIFSSFDYGTTWQLSINSAVEIMDVELVDYTWILFSDANGDWYESTHSGIAGSWSKVCTAGPVGKAFFVLHDGATVKVFCHDGANISRSTDVARNWTVVCDLSAMLISYVETRPGQIDPVYYAGLVIPAISGANDMIYASNGPYLALSVDAGDTFAFSEYWDMLPSPAEVYDLDSGVWRSPYPPRSIVYDRCRAPEFLVTDILVSSVDGPEGSDVTTLFLTKDLYGNADTKLNRVFKTFRNSVIWGGEVNGNTAIRYIYQQAVSLGALELSSVQVVSQGGTDYDKLLFSVMASADDNGNPVISMKYSTDGGNTFTYVDLSTIEVYSGNVDEEPDLNGGAFTHLDYGNIVFVGGPCTNSQYWSYSTGEKIQMLSYDLDVFIWAEHERLCGLTARIVKEYTNPYTLDANFQNIPSTGYDLAAYVEKIRPKPYLLAVVLQKIRSETYDLTCSISHRYDISYNLAAYVDQLLDIDYYLAAYVQGPRSQFYTLDAVFTASEFDEMCVRFERRIPQAWNLIFKPIAKTVYDSRIDPETD